MVSLIAVLLPSVQVGVVFDSDHLRDRTGHPLTVLGRLKPGVTPEQSTLAYWLARYDQAADREIPLVLLAPRA